MPGHLRTAVGLLLTTTALQVGLAPTPAVAVDAPVHTVVVSGVGEDDGVSTWPAYDPAVGRFAIDTSAATAGAVAVTASTTDPDGRITIDGRPAADDGPVRVDGLEAGDEITVAIEDSAGTSHQAFVYLPAGFPRLAAAGTLPAGSPPYVFLGLGSFLSATSYETVVDRNGVPVHVRETLEPHDFKAQDHGPAYTVFEPVKEDADPDDGEYGYQLLELDERFEQTGTRRLTPVDGITADETDFHDAQYLDDGRLVLVGYHHGDRQNGEQWLDSVIEIVDADGGVDFVWNSGDHVDDPAGEGYVFGLKPYRDYAHINSVEMLPNGDLLASFRNLGQVMRIATTAHDGFEAGDVVWKLGGEANQFTFDDPGFGGFCAQHDARLMPNGNLQLFDNGSHFGAGDPNALGGQTADMCPDPADPDGPRIARPQSRVVEYTLDEDNLTATRAWSFAPEGRYAAFAGNAQRLANGDTLVGWSDTGGGTTPGPVVSEVTQGQDEIWSLTAPGWFSYRAFADEAPDAIDPEVEFGAPDGPPDDSPQPPDTVVIDYTCTDRGGSTLQSCAGPVPSGTPWAYDGGPFVVTATDGAGNTTRDSMAIELPPPSAGRRPDVDIRRPGGTWHERRLQLSLDRAGDTATAVVRIRNRETRHALPVRGTSGNRAFDVRYFHGAEDITRRVLRGRMTTPELRRGETWTLRVEIRRTARAADGDHLTVPVRAVGSAGLSGRAQALLRAR